MRGQDNLEWEVVSGSLVAAPIKVILESLKLTNSRCYVVSNQLRVFKVTCITLLVK